MIRQNIPSTMRELGRYQIIGHLATGGMADVWLARAKGAGGFSKLVALKTLLPGYSTSREFVEMLIKEASVAAKLIHPGIVQIFDLGLIDNQYFIAMEYVPGLTMRHVLHHARRAQAKIPLAPVLNTFAEVCDALHYAHNAGLVHRDISPENVMITELGHAKVLDFGIVANRSAPVTQGGRVKGKYAYMSPEVFSNAPPHKSRDIWALGVVLYEIACGRRPFEGNSDAELILKIVKGEVVPPRKYVPDLPEEVEWTILRCLSLRTTDRPSSANELAAMLRILMHQAVAGGDDDAISRLLTIGRGSEHVPVFREHKSESADDLPMVSVDAEVSLVEQDLSTGDIDDIQMVAQPPPLPENQPPRFERTADLLFPQSRHVIHAQDTGNLFPAVRVKPNQMAFDIFGAYKKKR